MQVVPKINVRSSIFEKQENGYTDVPAKINANKRPSHPAGDEQQPNITMLALHGLLPAWKLILNIGVPRTHWIHTMIQGCAHRSDAWHKTGTIISMSLSPSRETLPLYP